MGDIAKWIEFAVAERARAELAEIERVCEAAVQGGKHGVFVRRTQLGGFISAEVNPMVPYGQIYESRTDRE